MKSITTTAALLTTSVSAFSPTFVNNRNSHVSLQMGLFDGVKDAFVAPALERSTLDSERETPIDRWMGWNVKSEEVEGATVNNTPDNFIDTMDAVNYVSTSLTKPMGITFEENDEEVGGIFVAALAEGGVAENDGAVKPGDQLVSVNGQPVAGLIFDDALSFIVNSETDSTKLIFFRGTEKQFYGPTGPSKDWVSEFISKDQ